MIETVKVKIGFVPSFRFRYTPWCQKMRDLSLAAFAQLPRVEVIAPVPSPDGMMVDAERGFTPYGMVSSLEQGEAVAEYFRRQAVDGVIIGTLDFGDERSSAKIAERLGVPVLLFATKEPPAEDEPGLGRVSDSYCGTLSTASGLYRRKIPFHFAGIFFPDEAAFKAEIEVFVRAVAVVKGLKGAQIGQIGQRPASFETVAYDETAMIRKFGQNVIHVDLSEIVFQAQKLADDDRRVIDLVNEIKSEIAQATITDDWVFKAAKMELTLRNFFIQNRLSAMAMSCWPQIQQMWGFSTCALFGRLTGQGMLTACETDILGALAMLVSYRAALAETVPHFIDWTIQHRQDDNCFLAWHCGNAPVCLAADPQRTALRSRRDMKGVLAPDPQDTQAGLYQFQLKPGKVTFCRLQEYDDEWKMLVTNGEIVPSDEELAGTWAWVRVANHERLYRTLIEEGFVHHASMIHGDLTKALKLAGKFLGIKIVEV